MILEITGARAPVEGRLSVPGDKSIAHRAGLFAALARGESRIEAFPGGADNRSTLRAVESLGAAVEDLGGGRVRIRGPGPGKLRAPAAPIDCGNSGTTARLLAGLLAGQGVAATLVGDASLSRRPMERVAAPLRELGARISTEAPAGTLPLRVEPAPLRPARVVLPVASAQVKSAVLLCGLGAGGRTRVEEPSPSRDHTEIMLRGMGADLGFGPGWAEISGPPADLSPLRLSVPGDPSSAAFLVVLASLRPGSDLRLGDLLLNPSRTGFLRILARMGARIEVVESRRAGGEEVGTLRVRGGTLRGTRVRAEEIPAAVDEIPILAVAMALAEGESRVEGAGELRLKESDRVAGVVAGLRAFGAEVEEHPHGFAVSGVPELRAAAPPTLGDHRLVMAFAVAAAVAGGRSRIDGAEAAAVSYPSFAEDLARVGVDLR